MSEGGQQRAFANRIKLQSAQEIRQSATATVKAATEKSRPKLHIVDPLDYEGELISRRKDLEKEKFLNLLLFPQQDVSVSEEEQKQRTEVPSVPSEALSKKSGLLTQECLKLYTSNWHRVTYNYARFGASFSKLLDSEYHQQLSPETFELDLIEEEKLQLLSSCGSGTPLSRRGYLYKGTFPQDGGISVSMKNYRKRWFVLTGCPSEGGYVLMFYKDEKSSNIKGKIDLDTCTEIKPNSRHKTYGFDLMTEDDKVFYPLAADSEAEMEEWTTILTRAIASEMDDTDGEGVNTLSSFYTKDTLIKDVKKLDIRPEMLEHSATIEAANAKAREKERRLLFNVYPELMKSSPSQYDTKPHAPLPEEKLGYRFIVKCNNLDFKLTTERNGERGNIEPFFVTLALYDAGKGVKISEDFHVDLNSPYIRQLVPPPDGTTDDGPHPLSQKATRATEAVFSVTIPNPEIYLVAKVEKILQGGISACAEAYMKAGENSKAGQKLAQQINAICARLGQHRMPFAWAVRPVFNEREELDTSTDFSALFKQDSQKLMEDDLLKLLADYKNIHKHKLQVIPSSLSIDVLPFNWPKGRHILTPSLLPVKAPPTSVGDENGDAPISSPRPSTPILEVQELPPLEAYNTTTHYYPHLSFTHHLYVYPISLKYDSQKVFTKARNIACCVQFKDSDSRDSKALPVIFSKTCSTTFSDRANTAVIHHCTTPSFYEEVKVKLPVELEPSHHLLFMFSHVACDVQKATKIKSSTKLPPVETIVGYAWLPLMDSKGRVSSGSHNLSVSASLPSGYLGLTPASPQSARSGALSPEVRWVDNQKQLFTVTIKLNSTVYTEDPSLHKFFKKCGALHSMSSQTPTMAELLSAIKVLEKLPLSSIVRFLPLILAQLFKLLSHSNKDVETIKPDIVRLLIMLVDKVVEADGTELLRSYIEYMFVTEVDTSKKKAVHDELARLLVQYLRQQNSSGATPHKLKLLDHLWFFLEIMLKSMAQYLFITKKISSSRKSRYPEDFGWNLQSLITSILAHIMENHNDLSARKANRGLADFVKQAFSFMDRGVVFKIVARYLEAFSVKETSQLSSVKLEFLKIICDHEHFISLNLPFPISTENMDFVLSDDFCRKHFLVGILLREVECSLEFDAGSVRRKTLEILRNLIAKHDCDSRYADPAQKARIALLYFPLVPLVLSHVDRLNTGCSPYISPMLNATSMAYFSSPRGQSVEPPSLPGSAFSTLKSNSDRDKSLDRNRQPPKNSHAEDQISLSEISEFSGLFPILAPSPTPTLTEQTMMEQDQLTEQETRDLLISVLFVLKYIDRGVLQHWWRECMGSSNTSAHIWSSLNDTMSSQFSQLLDFFDMLESCLYAFRYVGRQGIAIKIATSSLRQSDHPSIQPQQSLRTAPAPPSGKEKGSKKHSTGSLILSSPASSLMMSRGKPSRSTITSVTSSLSGPLSSLRGPMISVTPDSAEVDLRTNVESALSKEVGLVLLNLMDIFGTSFRRELSQEDGDNVLMSKFFSLFISFLQVCQSVSLQSHIFAMLRAFTFQFRETLFKGSSDFCGILCYEVLQCCNSRLQSTRTEATILLYLIMRGNFECFTGKRGFVRAHIQSTIAVSKLVTNLLGQNDTNLRKSLSTIATFVTQDEKVKGTNFPIEVQDLMKRLKTVLSSTSQMKIHQIDHEKLVDLHYTLAKSYSTSPELRQTWLDSMATLHLKYGNYSEAAHCCIHIAGLVAEYLRIKGQYPAGCTAFRHISPNIEREETSIKDDRETTVTDELTFTERNLVTILESSVTYLEQAERYEMMAEVFKLLQPFYEKARDFGKMKEMYGKLHVAFKRVVEIMATGKRYLGTYFRIAFYGKPFGDDNEKQFIYKEPKVTKLGELTLRLQKLYSRKFGNPDIVHIIKESGRVNPSSLNQEHAHIQITHVEPYFTSEELEARQTSFERQNRICRFVFETPFTSDGKPHGDVTKQCMRKTILTTSHWFPYVKKRILILDQEQFELSAIEVAIEAMDKKTANMSTVVKMDPPDLKGLQLLLQGSISTQVNQGVQEYSLFLKEPHVSAQPEEHIERLKEAYRSFIQVCQEALELNSSLISTDQLLYHDELKSKFQQMQSALAPLLDIQIKEEPQRPLSPTHPDSFRGRRGTNQADPHRMSAILFSSISGSK